VEIAGNCALSSLSIAGQALADVKRMPGLTGPICLFLLAVAESGDRKSTCDKWFTTAIRAYEREQEEKFEPLLKEYRAAFKAWKATGEGIESAIKQAAKSNKSTISLSNDLSVHEKRKPPEPRVPSLIRAGDDSSEQLAFSLAKKWPSAGTISAEAGSVFGGHAMGEGKIMRNLALQNVIWDGGSHQVGRRTSECFVVRGARLTIGLQAQEQVLREFCDQYGSLARGIGFFARFLFAWPQSMQGERFISTFPPEEPPAATVFNRRLSGLINLPVSMGADGALTPILLDMTEEARAAWVETHNGIERELRPFGDLKEIPDVASKAADNVARIAALFHLYQYGPTGRIDAETVLAAAKILMWHLNEARRFLAAFSMAPELAAAARIEEWLVKHCRTQGSGVNIVLRSELQQHGPHGLRKKKVLDAALDELADLNRVRQVPNGRKKEIHINPTLLRVQP
jgi:putative DNA primase/helicase